MNISINKFKLNENRIEKITIEWKADITKKAKRAVQESKIEDDSAIESWRQKRKEKEK